MEGTNVARNGTRCASCQQPGKLACSACLLVMYCSRACQVANRSHHKVSCTSPLIKSTWTPHWVQESRSPSFIHSGTANQVVHGVRKYFWGNIPALDFIRLEANEGLDYKKDLPVLLAASGDLRNVVKSMGSLPDEYTNRLCLFINDLDFEVVARNIIITLIGMIVEDRAQAVTCMLHVWYSALIRESDAAILTTTVLPLFEDVHRKIASKEPGAIIGKTRTFGDNTCRAELTKENWHKLLLSVQETTGLLPDKAHQIRAAVTLAPQRVDYRDRWLFSQQPAHRVCASRFFNEGLLLPFGASREEFVVPNPTLFQSSEWPMMDSANPLHGWSAADVLNTDSGPATGDLYGKLFYHISSHLTDFHDRLARFGTDFTFFNVDATVLRDQRILKGKPFARIEVSNISDDFYLGIAHTVGHLSAMLQNVAKTPHATMITLFMNAVREVIHNEEGSAVARRKCAEGVKQASKFLKLSLSPSMNSPSLQRLMAALHRFRDLDADFDKYMASRDFVGIEINSIHLVSGGVCMKYDHTIVEKWPSRLKLKHGQLGAQLEFNISEPSGQTGQERYVEWKRRG